MRKTILFVFLVVFGSGAAHAQILQNVWEVVDSNLTDGPLVFTSNDSGFIGTSANLYVTADGGKNFTSVPMPSSVFNSEVKDMCWPTSKDGYLLFQTTSGGSILTQTSDAGKDWNVVNLPSNLTVYSISFPVPGVGYATGEFNPINNGYFVAKSTDNGANWNVIKSSTLSTGPILFKTVQDGMFVIFSAAGAPQIYYTFDSLKDVETASEIPFGTEGEQNSFLRWNDDGSWIVQYEGLVRSSDSGKSWKTVLPDDPSGTTGTISTACFHGYRGLAFGDNSVDFQSVDFGATWHQFTNTVVQGTSYITYENDAAVPSQTCAMPSDTVAFTIEESGALPSLLRVAVPPAAVAESVSVPEEGIEVMQRGMSVEFTAGPQAAERSIEIYDVLGRELSTLSLPPMSTNAILQLRALQPGTYFARLGNSIAKFTVWQ